MSLLETLARRSLVAVTGKGGTGKSVLTAALGRILASRGRRVLLLDVDPRESLYQLLGIAPSGGDVVVAGERLRVQNLRPAAVLEHEVRRHLKLDWLSDRVVASPVYRHFTEGAPGLKEMAVLGHALRVVRGQASSIDAEVDVVLLDAPATGHGVSLLAAPKLVSEVIRDGPFGRMGQELAEFVADRRACGVAVVTTAEEMPAQEAVETLAAMRDRLGRGPELLVANQVYPDLGADAGDAPADEALALWRRRREVNDRELARLQAAWRGPLIELPFVPVERGPELVAELGPRLEAVLTSLPGEPSWS